MKTVLFCMLVLLVGCHKDEGSPLPKATQTGENTFGCLVDGKAFGPLPPQGITSSRRKPLEASLYRTDLLISARGNGGVDFALRNAFQPGTYPIRETNSASYGRYAFGSDDYYTDGAHTGTVTLTRMDTVAKVASGTFQFTALNYQSGKTVAITEGRFDVRLK